MWFWSYTSIYVPFRRVKAASVRDLYVFKRGQIIIRLPTPMKGDSYIQENAAAFKEKTEAAARREERLAEEFSAQDAELQRRCQALAKSERLLSEERRGLSTLIQDVSS